jgi:hypothetical protein
MLWVKTFIQQWKFLTETTGKYNFLMQKINEFVEHFQLKAQNNLLEFKKILHCRHIVLSEKNQNVTWKKLKRQIKKEDGSNA